MATPAPTGGVFPPFDSSTFLSQLLWLAISFGVLYWLMANVILPRFGEVMEARRNRIEGDLDAAAKSRADAEEAAAVYEKALSDARANAQALATKARNDLSAKSEERRKSVEADLAKKLAKSEAQIGRRKADAMSNVRGIAVDAAEAILAKVAGKPVARDRIGTVYERLNDA